MNILRFTMTQPNERIQGGIETSKTFKVDEKIPNSWTDFEKSLVFKVKLRGRSILKVEVIAVDKTTSGGKFLRNLFRLVTGAAIPVWARGFSNPYVGAATQVAGKSLVDLVGNDDDVHIVGAASQELDSKQLLNSPLDLPLIVPKDVSARRRKQRKTPEVILRSGDENGRITLRIDTL